MPVRIFVLFLILGSAYGGITIKLEIVDDDIHLPKNENIEFSEYKWLGGGATGRIVLVTYCKDNYNIDLVLKLVPQKKNEIYPLLGVIKEYKILLDLKGAAVNLKPAAFLQGYGYGFYSGDDEGTVLVLQHVPSPNLNALGFDLSASTMEVLTTGLDLKEYTSYGYQITQFIIRDARCLGVVLIDWGSAELISRKKKGRCGTIAFMSPNVDNGLGMKSFGEIVESRSISEYSPDDDLRSVLYVLGKAGYKGSLPWEITSVFSFFSLLFKDDINEQKEKFESQLHENKKLDPELIHALLGIRSYLQSNSSRVPKNIDYNTIRQAFKEAITVVGTRRDVSWSTYLRGLFGRVATEKTE